MVLVLVHRPGVSIIQDDTTQANPARLLLLTHQYMIRVCVRMDEHTLSYTMLTPGLGFDRKPSYIGTVLLHSPNPGIPDIGWANDVGA